MEMVAGGLTLFFIAAWFVSFTLRTRGRIASLERRVGDLEDGYRPRTEKPARPDRSNNTRTMWGG